MAFQHELVARSDGSFRLLSRKSPSHRFGPRARLAQGAFSSAFSVGQGYEPQPLNPLASYQRVDRYFLDLRAKTRRSRKRVVTGRGQVVTPNATTLAQTALGWWERHLDGEPAALRVFLTHANALLGAAQRDGNLLLWRYDVDVAKYARDAPWYSCMAQGQAASVLVRAHLATGRETFADGAVAALRPLERAETARGMVTDTAHGPVFEECPTQPASHILNGWVFALWALWDVSTAIDADPWALHLERSANALDSMLPEYDVGWWTRYSLFPRPDDDLAKPGYHVIHANQMEATYRLTGLASFREAHRRWHDYDRPANRARAVAVKGVGVALDRLLARS
jgi:hypothetical protein